MHDRPTPSLNFSHLLTTAAVTAQLLTPATTGKLILIVKSQRNIGQYVGFKGSKKFAKYIRKAF